MLGRSIDQALRASDQRYQVFADQLEERRERFDKEMEQRYREEVQITREFMRRNELLTQQMLKRLDEMGEEIRAQTKAIFQVLDRFENGGEAAAS